MKVGDLKTIRWPQPSSKGTMKYFLSSPSKVKGYFDQLIETQSSLYALYLLIEMKCDHFFNFLTVKIYFLGKRGIELSQTEINL